MGSLRNLVAGLDEDALRRGKQIERICKWFLGNDPIYRKDLRPVWLWACREVEVSRQTRNCKHVDCGHPYCGLAVGSANRVPSSSAAARSRS